MNMRTVFIEEKRSDTLKTEVLFNISCAKASGQDLLKIDIPESDLKIINLLERILKSAKKEGLIQLFIFSDSLSERKTEALYLYNLYSELEEIKTEKAFFLIKL